MKLYEKVNYTSNISYLTNTFIYEYDISKCNINVLYVQGIIDDDTYNYLYNAKRMVREVYIGKLQKKDPNITEALKAGIIEAKRLLFEVNDIKDNEVLSIKNDAVFIINNAPQITTFNTIQFKLKHTYTSYYKLRNLECYYYYNSINEDENITIKGISDSKLILHKEYMLQLLKDVMYSIQVNGPEVSMQMLKDFYNEYVNFELPVGYYRTLDIQSNYKYRSRTMLGTTFESESVYEQDKTALDISYNIKILMDLQRILVSIYFNNHK